MSDVLPAQCDEKPTVKDKLKKGCFRRGCLRPIAALVVLYALWSLWTGWLGPDKVEPAGTGIVSQVFIDQLIVHELNSAKARGMEGYLNLLRRPIPWSLRRPAVGSEDSEVAAGLRFPREYQPMLRQQHDSHPEDVSGAYLLRNFVEYHYALRYQGLSEALWEAQSSEFVKWLAERSDVLPPRRIDTVLLSYGGGAGGGGGFYFWRDTAESWRRMANGKNPYYRKRALSKVRYWARDWDEERALYLRALQEQSDAFLAIALCAIQNHKLQDPDLMNAVARVAQVHPAGHDPTWSEDIKALAEDVLNEMRTYPTVEDSTTLPPTPSDTKGKH